MESTHFVAHPLSPPSPSPSVSTRKNTTPWFFPGPSSRFNTKHERSKTQIYFQRPYIPTSPILSTAIRAHRRAQSSANVPTTNISLLSPPASNRTSRNPLSRAGSTDKSPTMAASAHAPAHMQSTARDDPITPAKGISTSTSSRPSSKLQDSPFSDYFTDDGRSANDAPSYQAPSSETQQLLVRLNKLQSQLMRNSDGATDGQNLNIIAKKIGEIEWQLNAIHSQTRMPLEDSGLFLEEDEDEDRQAHRDSTPDANRVPTITALDGTSELLNSPVITENEQVEHDKLILEAQKVLASVTRAQQQLRERHREIRALNDTHISQMEERDREIETLRSENEVLKSDIGFDHSELLFLKLQFKALEVEVEALDDSANSLEQHAPALRDDIQRVKQDRVREEFSRWEKEWADVNGRMRRRRSKSPEVRSDAGAGQEGGVLEQRLDPTTDVDPAADDWRLETVVKSDAGRVQKITIQRLNHQRGMLGGLDGTADEEPMQNAGEESGRSRQRLPQSPNPIYTTQGTQTETASMPLSLILDSNDQQEETATRDTGGEIYEYDCAITTSSEDNSDMDAFSDDEDDTDRSQRSPIKTAWQDLWEGIANLAGAREDHF